MWWFVMDYKIGVNEFKKGLGFFTSLAIVLIILGVFVVLPDPPLSYSVGIIFDFIFFLVLPSFLISFLMSEDSYVPLSGVYSKFDNHRRVFAGSLVGILIGILSLILLSVEDPNWIILTVGPQLWRITFWVIFYLAIFTLLGCLSGFLGAYTRDKIKKHAS